MLRTTLASMLALACALLIAPSTGCGGGGGGGGSSSAFFTPKASVTSPTDGATDISIRSTQVKASFDSNMDASTINATTFIVEDVVGGFPVVGSIAYDANLREATWTLTQVGLNASFPTEASFAFNTIYRVRLTSGILSRGLPIVPAVTAQFLTSQTEFGLVASGTDPQNGASGVLIDPYRTLVNGQLAFATLKVRIDVALDPSTVNGANVQLHVGGAAGASVATLVGFDTASNTIFVAPDGAANPNPAFPGEPLLATNTAYTLVITTAVKSTAGAAPSQPVLLGFTTINCNIRPPATISGANVNVDLVLAEAFPNPTTTNAATDSNGDGTAERGNDEFSEIVNISSDYLNLMEHKLADSGNIGTPTGALITWSTTTLPAGSRHLALLAPGCSIVVWNGPGAGGIANIPAGIPSAKLTIGHSKAFFAGKFSGGMLGNSGDTLIMQQLSPAIGTSGNVLQDDFTNSTSGASTASSVRVNGTSGSFTSHLTASGAAALRFSPGLQTNGAVYR